MALRRGPDGKIIDSPTEPAADATRRLERPLAGVRENEPRLGDPSGVARGRVLTANPDADTASVRDREMVPRRVETGSADAERTRLIGPARRSKEGGEATTSETAEDPVVGWLVVIEGPGRGQARAIGYGMNSIGRGPTERISLEFGDSQMSRTSHAVVTYDPRSRKFYLQHGGGRNLTYLGEQAVMVPTEIASGAEILLGATRLRFVALCGPDFDWQDS